MNYHDAAIEESALERQISFWDKVKQVRLERLHRLEAMAKTPQCEIENGQKSWRLTENLRNRLWRINSCYLRRLDEVNFDYSTPRNKLFSRRKEAAAYELACEDVINVDLSDAW